MVSKCNLNKMKIYESIKFRISLLLFIIVLCTLFITSFNYIKIIELNKFSYEIGELDRLTFQIKKNFIFQVIITTSLYILFIVYLKKTIFKPIEKISNNFRWISKYYYGKDFNVRSKDEIGQLMNNFNKLRRKMDAIENLSQQINIQDNFEDVLDYLFDNFKPFIPYDRIGIAILDNDRKRIYALKARSNYPIKLSDRYSTPIENTSLKSIIQTGETRIINDLEKYLKENPFSESTKLIVEEGMKASITLPLNVKNHCIGVIFFSSTIKNTYTESHVSFLRYIAQHIAISFENSFLQEQFIVSTINGFAKLIESKDNETGLHIERMRSYAYLITEKLSKTEKYRDVIDNKFKRDIYNFSPLHDIGKVGIPDKILLKNDRLSDEEFAIMKTHTTIGGNILLDMEKKLNNERKRLYKVGIEISKYHHEKYDGSGYPEGLKENEIPLSARIVAIADVFDALTSERPYKKTFSLEKSFNIIKEESGKHFDPFIVDIFFENKKEIINIYNHYKQLEEKSIESITVNI